MLEQLRIHDRIIIALHTLGSAIDGLTDNRHLTTDPLCARYQAPASGSRLGRVSHGHGCTPCMFDRSSLALADYVTERSCRICGCTDLDCSGCVERTGRPCAWVPGQRDLCTACVDEAAAA
jgi:hypothetical protein